MSAGNAERMRRDAETLLELVARGEQMYDLLRELAHHDENDFGPWTAGMQNRVSTVTQLWRSVSGPKEIV